jgi:hypothetical protein
MLKSKNIFKNIWLWILATVVLGTFWHFGYELFAKNFVAGLVFPVNESVWEHQKIVYFPLVIAGVVAYIKSKPRNAGIWVGTLVGVMLAMLAVFFGFYLYSSIIGESLIADILLFIASIILGMYAGWWVTANLKSAKKLVPLAITGLILILGLLVYWTIWPPRLEPFIEKSSNTYGINEYVAD